MDVAELGMTQEEIQTRIIDRCCNCLLSEAHFDDEGNEVDRKSMLASMVREEIKARIDAGIERFVEKHILPNAVTYLENLTLQEASKWGQPKGDPISFQEYLVAKAEAYLTEKVDFQGRAKGDGYNSGWTGTQTRLTSMIHAHLHYSIETAMKKAIGDANAILVQALGETAKTKLGEIAAALKVEVKTGR